MNKKTIRFALAVDHVGYFQSQHFGDADKYLIYEWQNTELEFVKEEINPYKTFDEEKEHGSKRKGGAIVSLLKSMDVNVLVSTQFGKNIKLVNLHFIPVIIYSEKTADEVLPLLKKHLKWIEDEFINNPQEYKLFRLKNGVLKTIIKKAGKESEMDVR
jgi:predicted Fe-Mo cluster-binding NifX family protein